MLDVHGMRNRRHATTAARIWDGLILSKRCKSTLSFQSSLQQLWKTWIVVKRSFRWRVKSSWGVESVQPGGCQQGGTGVEREATRHKRGWLRKQGWFGVLLALLRPIKRATGEGWEAMQKRGSDGAMERLMGWLNGGCKRRAEQLGWWSQRSYELLGGGESDWLGAETSAKRFEPAKGTEVPFKSFVCQE